jgi:DNA (cytosine-5)-methyltransferase 1
MTLTIGSLFSGIGGLEFGLEAALTESGIPHHIAWQVEIEPFCRAVLAAHWPNVDRSVTDVRAATSLPSVDLVCGGFPCQDTSSAGKGLGLAGPKSGLWFAYRDVVAAIRPALVIVENPASGAKRWLCRVRSDLHALGYRTTAYQLGAHHVGAPHRRERIFVVAHSERMQLRQQPRGRSGTDRPAAPIAGSAGEDLAHADNEPAEQREERGDAATESDPLVDDTDVPGQQRPEARSERGGRGVLGAAVDGRHVVAPEPGVGRGVDGLPARLDLRLPDRWPAGRGAEQEAWEPSRTVTERHPTRRARLRALGNAVVPAQAREIGRAIIASGLLR